MDKHVNTIEDARAAKTVKDKICYYDKCDGNLDELARSLRLRLEEEKEISMYCRSQRIFEIVLAQELDCILACVKR